MDLCFYLTMDLDPAALPDDVAALKDIVRSALAALDAAKADAAAAQAERSDIAAYIAHLKLQIEKLKRTIYGPRGERTARLLNQMEFELEDLEATATEDELRAEQAAVKRSATSAVGITRKRPSRQPFPEHMPRERIVLPGPDACTCCGDKRLAKLGETVSETLESTPRQYKVLQYVREKFTCRNCETISQTQAPFQDWMYQSHGMQLPWQIAAGRERSAISARLKRHPNQIVSGKPDAAQTQTDRAARSPLRENGIIQS